MEELDRLRAQIDGIDAELLRLFERRMDCAAQIAEEKQRQNLAVFDPEREKAVLERKEQQLSDPALTDYYRDWQRHTMALSRDRQAERLRRSRSRTRTWSCPA